MSDKIYKKYLPIIVCLLQLMGLFLLRQLWLRTVFQTVATCCCVQPASPFCFYPK